jgi:hypothetical protein
METAIQPQTALRLRKKAGTLNGALDHRFDRSSSHSALSLRHHRTLTAMNGEHLNAADAYIHNKRTDQ